MPTKTKRTDYFVPKYCKKVVEFIVDKICDGLTLSDVAKTYGPPTSNIVPNEKNLYRWQKKYPEFKEQVYDAYRTLLMRLIDTKLQLADRAMELSSIVNSTAEDDINEEIKKAKFELDAIKVKQRALEFTLTRIAPKFVPELQDKPQSTHAGLPPIVIKQYIAAQTIEEGGKDEVKKIEQT